MSEHPMAEPGEETVENLHAKLEERGATNIELEHDDRLGMHELWFELDGKRRQARGYSKRDAYYAALTYIASIKGSQGG